VTGVLIERRDKLVHRWLGGNKFTPAIAAQ